MVKNSDVLNSRAHECHDHNEVQLIFQLSVHMIWYPWERYRMQTFLQESAMLTSVTKHHSVGHRAASFKIGVQESHFEINWKGIYNLWEYISFLNDVANLGDLKHWSSVCVSSAVDSAHWSWMHSSRTRSRFSAVKLAVWVECMWLSVFSSLVPFKLSYIASY